MADGVVNQNWQASETLRSLPDLPYSRRVGVGVRAVLGAGNVASAVAVMRGACGVRARVSRAARVWLCVTVGSGENVDGVRSVQPAECLRIAS